MPVARSSDHRIFEVIESTRDVTVTGLASPSRGATEILMYRIDLAPGAALPPHRHDHEEVFHLLSGTLTSVQGGERIAVRAGDAVMIPPSVLHSAQAGPDGAVLLVAMREGTRTIRPDGASSVPPWGNDEQRLSSCGRHRSEPSRPLCKPHAPGRACKAGQASAYPSSTSRRLHVVAEPARGVLLNREAPGTAPWATSPASPAHRRDQSLLCRLEPALPADCLDEARL
jgi:quercetin dioxygenase-like cupin family protein